jgi:hypothetical protein
MDEFDPSACPGDHQGAVTVRVESGYAFRMPAEVFSVRDPLSPPDDASLPPYGCPGNPIIARAVSTYMGMTQFLPEGFEPHREMRRPVSLTLFGHDGPRSTVENWARRVEIGPENRGSSCLTPSGGIMDVCTGCSKAATISGTQCRSQTYGGAIVPLLDIGFVMRARPDTHPEAAGLPLTAHCTRRPERDPTFNKARRCEATYALGADLYVVYGYDGNIVTPTMLPAFDLKVRDWIAARRAPDLDGPARNIFEERR